MLVVHSRRQKILSLCNGIGDSPASRPGARRLGKRDFERQRNLGYWPLNARTTHDVYTRPSIPELLLLAAEYVMSDIGSSFRLLPVYADDRHSVTAFPFRVENAFPGG